MQSDTKEFPASVLFYTINNPGQFVPKQLDELLAWMTGEVWVYENYEEGISIIVPWLNVWFPEISKAKALSELPSTYHVPQINR